MMHRRRRVLIAVLGAGVVVIGIVALLWTRQSAHPVSVDEARRRMGPSTSSRGETTSTPDDVLRQPAVGVYMYKGSGTDMIHTPSKSQPEGPDMPVTVTSKGEGCWEFRIDYSSNHWQSWDYCARDANLSEQGGQTYQKWDFVVFANESTTTFVCDASIAIRAGQRPGEQWTQTCHDRDDASSVSSGPYRYVGREVLRIGDSDVPAHRYHRERTMRGDQSGSERSDVWFAVDTGLPLRNERSIDVSSNTVIGDVRYTEEASFEATSVHPT